MAVYFGQSPDRTLSIDKFIAERYSRYHNGIVPPPVKNKYLIVGDRVEEVKEIVVHQFSVSDYEDPDLAAADPLIEWEKSEFGQWVMQHSIDVPTWHRMLEPVTYLYKYQIRAKFSGPRLTELALKYGFK